MTTAARALWRWWNTPYMAVYGRFILLIVAVLGLFWFLYERQDSQEADARLLVYIVATSVLVVLTTIAGVLFVTRAWTLRASGLVCYVAAAAVLFTRFANGYYGWYSPRPWTLDLSRSLFSIGSTLLVAGVALWVVRTWRARDSGGRGWPP